MKKFLTCLMLSLVAVISFSSCESERLNKYYFSPLVGTWELYSINDLPVDYADIVMFTFHDDGTGVYGQFNPGPPKWNEYRISWEYKSDPRFDYLYERTWDGQLWTYVFQVEQLGLYQTLTLFDVETQDLLKFKSSI